jgi:hypothetical protein
LQKYPDSDIWCAWGAVVEKREYLKKDLKTMLTKIASGKNNKFKCLTCTKEGHPKHPLYARKDSLLKEFEVEKYSYIN